MNIFEWLGPIHRQADPEAVQGKNRYGISGQFDENPDGGLRQGNYGQVKKVLHNPI
jgi:hypothetical protein